MKNFAELLELAAMLAGDDGATIPEIRERLDYASRSSIYLDYENLFKHFNLAVFKNNEKRGREVVYRIDKEDWVRFKKRFISGILNEDDRLLLSFMLESVGSTSPLISASGEEFIKRLKSLVGDLDVEPCDYKGFFSLESTRYLLTLLKAQKNRTLIHIAYKDKEYDVYVLKCYAFSGGLYAYVMKEDGSVFNISIPRIVSVTQKLLTDRKTGKEMPSPQLDIKKALKDPFGIIRIDEPFTAVIKLRDNQGKFEMEKTWPDSVKIEPLDDSTHLFTVTTNGLYWLWRWVMSLGPQAEVLEPAWFREKIKESFRYTLEEIYKDN